MIYDNSSTNLTEISKNESQDLTTNLAESIKDPNNEYASLQHAVMGKNYQIKAKG